MKLTQRLVTRYAKYNALKNALEKWLKAKREEVLDALKAGQKCPDRGPYLIELNARTAAVDWRAEFRAFLVGMRFSEEAIDEKLASIESQPRDKQPYLQCTINPAHRGKVTLRLPRA